MGCRCCKMLQSYIFDPQEVQTSDYITEITNCKFDEQDGGKFKSKLINDIPVHKNKLQNSEVQTAANRNKLNSTKDAVQNHRGTALHEEGLGNSIEKCNGIHSYPNLNTNHSAHLYSNELSNSSVKRVSEPQTYDNHETIKNEGPPKLLLGTAQTVHLKESQRTDENTSSIQGAIQDGQSNLSGPSDPSDIGKLRAVKSKNPSSHHTHAEQSTECTDVSQHSRDLPSWESKSCDSRGKTCRTGLLNPCFEDKMASDIMSPGTKAGAVSEAKYDGHEEVNGELEVEDADVAEALAALEAATAGEDSEEEEGY
ncbi:uncharacterized protein C4orf19 homolog [Sceloporus undulatus]|uniref:uncharacterized protein C4orf19 homolog n=1 Tax=Sceloporus undulatus TaxID=8520 RepID=UPI001C4D3528|nr:uncharacterized protein C4orf19 homolog [Sceloporus undulatus]XP_042324919.1 uncharacterized protein C4orf19 homolog [Sceloporus undulatus]